MREFLTCLRLAIREVLRPSPWAEPERDETTPQVIADWVGRHKHPRDCAGGCRCEVSDG